MASRILPILSTFVLGIFAGCSRPTAPASGGGAASPTLTAQLAEGEALFNQSCAQCHLDGSGGPTAPPLRGSSAASGPTGHIIEGILRGRSGIAVVDGKKFNGIMPPQAFMTDNEIAAVTAYVRGTFGARNEPVDPAEVARMR